MAKYLDMYLDTEAVALFLARRCSFFSARDESLVGSLNFSLASTCNRWLSDIEATALRASVVVEPNELLRDRKSVVLRGA